MTEEVTESVLHLKQWRVGDGAYLCLFGGSLPKPKALMVLNEKVGQLTWSLPGGSVEEHEGLLDAACRESQIETGIPERTLRRCGLRPVHRDGAPFETTARGRRLFAHWGQFRKDDIPEKFHPQESEILALAWMPFSKDHWPSGWLWEGERYPIRRQHITAVREALEAFEQLKEQEAFDSADGDNAPETYRHWDDKPVLGPKFRERGWSPRAHRAAQRRNRKRNQKLG